MLANRSAPITTTRLREVADLLSLKWDEALADLPSRVDEVLQSGRRAPFLCAEVVRAVCTMRPDAEALAWRLADSVLAQLLGWSHPVPMLMADRSGAAFLSHFGFDTLRDLPDREMLEDAGLLSKDKMLRMGSLEDLSISGAEADEIAEMIYD